MTLMVAVTDSPEGRHALAAAATEAARLDTDLMVINLRVDPIEDAELPSEVKTTVLDRRLDLDPAENVLTVLRENADRVDRLVIGVKRRSPVGKAVLGSISQTLLLEADVPVLAVKLPAGA